MGFAGKGGWTYPSKAGLVCHALVEALPTRSTLLCAGFHSSRCSLCGTSLRVLLLAGYKNGRGQIIGNCAYGAACDTLPTGNTAEVRVGYLSYNPTPYILALPCSKPSPPPLAPTFQATPEVPTSQSQAPTLIPTTKGSFSTAQVPAPSSPAPKSPPPKSPPPKSPLPPHHRPSHLPLLTTPKSPPPKSPLPHHHPLQLSPRHPHPQPRRPLSPPPHHPPPILAPT